MIESILYAVFAVLGLGFLVFIHELGHYWVARRQGMRVEAFAIGFGKPIYTWEFQGVKWHICWLPFGGYVRIAGMQREKGVDPSRIPDGFYGKKPWQRIQVALAGPLVNIFFALVVFAVLWLSGGRDKNFAEFTHRIGWVDPKSALYEYGVRPGDVIQKYEGRDFQGFRDLMVSSIMNHDRPARLQGYTRDYVSGATRPFDYTLKPYEDPRSVKDKVSTIGVLSPAQYLIYDQKLPSASAKEIGLQPKDRLVWVDGEVLFSSKQLSSLVNESTSFLTVERNQEIFQTKVPRVHIDDLKLNVIEKAEIDDWQHEAGIKGRFQDLFFIPYNLSPGCFVEGRIGFIDEVDQIKAFSSCERCSYFYPLQEGDRIVAIDGQLVSSAYEFLDLVQTRRILMIVDRDPKIVQKTLWTNADSQFEEFGSQDLNAIVSSIGTDKPVVAAGDLHLLNPITPKPLTELPLSASQKSQLMKDFAHSKKEIEKSVQDPQKRGELLGELERNQKKLVLGIPLKDREVLYNPSPLDQFGSVLEDTGRTLTGLFSGDLNPKYMSGPVGIVHVVHQSWMVGVKEALFWMAVISLNLGLINLLPIPVLDGGHIMFSLYEVVTGRSLRYKTMEKLIIPFIGLLIAFFVFVTYQDILRLFLKFF